MKAFALALSIFGLFLSQAKAADDSEFKNSGEVRLRYFSDENSSGRAASDQRSDSSLRFKLNIAARKGENLQAYVSLLNNTQFGAQNSDSGDFSTVTSPGAVPPASSSASTNNLLIVNRAWGLWKANESLSFRVGRFGISIADGAVFAENEWQAVPTSHEGLEAAVDTDFAKIAAYFTKTHELGLPPASEVGAPSSDPERNLYLLTADLKNLPDAVKTANLHFVYVTRDRTDEPTAPATPYSFLNGSQAIQHVGLTLGGDISGFIYKATGAWQMGTYSRTLTNEQQLNASMVDGLIGYTNSEYSNLRLTAGFHMDSGNSPSFTAADSEKYQRYQNFYYERHDYAGLMDLVGWGNLTYWNIEGSFYPSEDFELGARTYVFSQTQSGDPEGPAFGQRFKGLVGQTGAQSDIGKEIDAYGTKYYEGGFKVHGRLSAFFPGDFFKQSATPRDKTFFQAMFQGAFDF